MKKQAFIMAAAAVLVLSAVIGGTIAAPTITANKTGDTTINIEDLEVALAASVGSTITEVNVGSAVPGHVVDCPEYVVKNTITEGYDVYARVTIDKQWKNSDGSVDTNLDASVMHLLYDGKELTKDSIPEGWMLFKMTDEQVILYYTKPLKASNKNNATSTFLSTIEFDKAMDNTYTDKTAVISITVDAVQASIGEKAIGAEWGVVPTIDANGVITAITE